MGVPPLTAPFSYLRVHGGKGFRGYLDEATLKKFRSALVRQKPTESFVMFNNTFFDSRGESCTADGEKITYAAVCNAVQFASL